MFLYEYSYKFGKTTSILRADYTRILGVDSTRNIIRRYLRFYNII